MNILVKHDRHLEDQSGTIECYRCASLLSTLRDALRGDAESALKVVGDDTAQDPILDTDAS